MSCRRRRTRKRFLLYAVIIFVLYRCIIVYALDVVIFNLTPQLPSNTSSHAERTAMQAMVEDAQKKYLGIFNIAIRNVFGRPYQTCEQSEDDMAAMAAKEYYQDQIRRNPGSCYALMLGNCSVTEELLQLSQEWNIPVLSAVLQSSATYPTFFQIGSTVKRYCEVLMTVLDHFRWHRVAFVLDIDESDRFYATVFKTARTLVMEEYWRDKRFTFELLTFAGGNDQSRTDALTFGRQQHRIFLLGCRLSMVPKLLKTAGDLDMANGEYAYLSYQPANSELPADILDFKNATLTELDAYRSLLVFSYLQSKQYFGIRSSLSEISDMVEVYTQLLIENYGDILQSSRYCGGSWLARQIANRTFQLSSGPVYIDENRTRDLDWALFAYNVTTGSMQVTGKYNPVGRAMQWSEFFQPDWPGNHHEPPLDEPICGFSGKDGLCLAEENRRIRNSIGGTLGGVAALILFTIAARTVYQYLTQDGQPWLLSTDLLKCFPPSQHPVLSQESSLDDDGDLLTVRLSLWDAGKWNVQDLHLKWRTLPAANNANDKVVSGQAQYNSADIWVTVIRCSIQIADLRENKQLASICRTVYSLHHHNVNVFVGACASFDSTSYLFVEEYCARGSLHDFMFSRGLLDKDIQISFTQDLLEGLRYIHGSSIKFHGKLNSLCCLIASRFLLKIAKTGYQRIRSLLKEQDERQVSTWSNLWRPPEHDIDLHKVDFDAEQKADIYSLGILLYEILTNRQLLKPRGHDRRLERLRPSPFFVNSDTKFIPLVVQNVITQCWDTIPSHRPHLDDIRVKILVFFPLEPGQSVAERSLLRLEQYAQELEIKVVFQTRQLMEEETFRDTLLAERLPLSVVELLRLHMDVEPELFQSATIYSSEIDGFAEMTQFATPEDVIMFLNNVYACLDPLITVYDVHRVQTVCDAYVIVSGVPVRNGDYHAEVICAMALKLMETYIDFEFREATDLRAGIHTGPVMVCSVGFRVPSYRLFGNTIKTAHYLKDHGQPGRIHISQATAELLQDKPQYPLVSRGDMRIDDTQQKMETFWLQMKDDHYEDIPVAVEERPPKFHMYIEEPEETEIDDRGIQRYLTLEEKKDRELRKFTDNSEISDPYELIQRISRMSARRPQSNSSSNSNGDGHKPEPKRKPSSSLFNADSEDKEYQDFLTNSEITAPQDLCYGE